MKTTPMEELWNTASNEGCEDSLTVVNENALEAAFESYSELLAALEEMVNADDAICCNRGLKSDQTMMRIAALDMAERAIAKAKGQP